MSNLSKAQAQTEEAGKALAGVLIQYQAHANKHGANIQDFRDEILKALATKLDQHLTFKGK